MYTEHYAHPALSRIRTCHTVTSPDPGSAPQSKIGLTNQRAEAKQARSHPQIPSHKCRSHEPGVWSKESKEVAG
ncbi:hypothetical protein B0H12DRAFT_1107771 [Mycena haematopus]|nr:hypothetical protein B0H12DRAFT_1131996 [Mycena haematopus]KAJ7254940.1 hypothetical protein B0H12DRAFT_1114281 [Mycena haematopus]KAJ7260319.1 hypothetical protein B0H12DRAFT_1107771 [Mycena haematopus]